MNISFDDSVDTSGQSTTPNRSESKMDVRNLKRCTNCQEGYIYIVKKKKVVKKKCPECKGTGIVPRV